MRTVIELDEVRYDAEDVTGRLALSLSVDAGDSVVLLGPARCGKGLVLRLCAGLLVPEEGRGRFESWVKTRRRRVTIRWWSSGFAWAWSCSHRVS